MRSTNLVACIVCRTSLSSSRAFYLVMLAGGDRPNIDCRSAASIPICRVQQQRESDRGRVPWMKKLCMITYPPHQTKAAPTKLYENRFAARRGDPARDVGGTMLRDDPSQSNQLIIGRILSMPRQRRAVTCTKLSDA